MTRAWLLIAVLLTTGCAARRAAPSLTPSQPDAHEPCVQLKVRPRLMFVKQDIDTSVRVAQHEDHRRLIISWTSDVGAGGVSERQLEGKTAALRHTLWLRDQLPGNYEFVATVFDNFNRIVDVARITILGPDREPNHFD
jgi:hypothetical protein